MTPLCGNLGNSLSAPKRTNHKETLFKSADCLYNSNEINKFT